jgi:hypothetical protein
MSGSQDSKPDATREILKLYDYATMAAHRFTFLRNRYLPDATLEPVPAPGLSPA